MFIVRYFQRFASLLSTIGAYGAAGMILFMAGIILLEIVLRTGFASSTFMMDELVSYAVAASGFLALGYAFEQHGIIRVTLLLGALESKPKARTAVEFVCLFLTIFIVGFLIYYLYINVERQFVRGYSSGTMSGMPQWIPTGVALTGLVIFWIQLVSYGLQLTFVAPPPAEEALPDISSAQ